MVECVLLLSYCLDFGEVTRLLEDIYNAETTASVLELLWDCVGSIIKTNTQQHNACQQTNIELSSEYHSRMRFLCWSLLHDVLF